MKPQPSSRRGGRVPAFVPKLEALEERCVPVANFVVQGHLLKVFVPTVAVGQPVNKILVFDNGSNRINNIQVFANNTSFLPNVSINRILFICGGSSDRITYNLTGPVVSGRNVQVFLGGGNDLFQMTVRQDVLAGKLNVSVDGGAGNDVISLTQIGSLPSSSLSFTANGGAGNDAVLYTTTSFIDVEPDSHITLNMEGGDGSDLVRARFSGLLNGTMNFILAGDAGVDQVGATVNVAAGSTGQLIPSRVLGGTGNDTLTFLVHNNSMSATTFNQLLDGDGGIDTSLRTNDVIQFHCEHDTVVN
jgi:hypothetical protein